jgi:hypothetical protein
MRGSRSSKCVDGLRRITNDTQLLALADPQIQQTLLQRRDVLVFVYGEPAVRLMNFFENIAPRIKDRDQQQEHVFKIDEATLCLDLIVGSEDSGNLGCVDW